MKIYVISYLSLVALLALTVLMASVHLGNWSMEMCLFIATLKALIILMFFMHIAKDRKYSFIIIGLLLFFLAALILVLSDFRMRVG